MQNINDDSPVYRRLKGVKSIILVLSGKGGVGKSSVATQLALSAATSTSSKVGLLDVDLTGPSIPRMLGLDGQSVRMGLEGQGWVPVRADKEGKLSVMSIGFLLKSKNDAVVWRGPKKTAMIRQFLADVKWDCDTLIIDTPPGTSDEHIALTELLSPLADKLHSVIVTTPQAVALSDVQKEISFTKTVGIPVLGLIENMSGYACPHCADCTNVFSTGGGESLAKREKINFLGKVPIDPLLVKLLDDIKVIQETNSSEAASTTLIERYKGIPTYKVFETIAKTVLEIANR
ncbi:P-loop containing nucleoside triphosphate hydrolase protein [Wallemia mellicola CBS 633.66]|nr:P-loop containing nucleoside triphosphate hydrolase protein [Wallemia mellicola CBS 633.66]EIM24174.1 P-loop containing nucleoside triphosphate hydrolase protein [Wallemia mellicola CBS 633.66]|eukprot:XP_006955995.1 P-loop containing nucleoside triphosphate hydrolase protein [Wallemia mellicola CBS 633.66]